MVMAALESYEITSKWVVSSCIVRSYHRFTVSIQPPKLLSLFYSHHQQRGKD